MIKKTGFTLVEVLIAIGVFSVGVLAVLNLVIHNLSTLDRTEIKTISTLLAKEGIEMAFHVRDANLAKELPWNCIFSNDLYTKDNNFDFNTQVSDSLEEFVCKGYFGSGDAAVYQLQVIPAQYYTINSFPYEEDFMKRFDQHRLYLYTDDISKIHRYGYQGKELSGEASFFARYLEYTPVKEGDKELPSDKLLKVTSHVLFQKGGLTGEIVLESFIGQH